MSNGPILEESLELIQERIHFILKNTTKATSFLVGYPIWKDHVGWKLLYGSPYLKYFLDIPTSFHGDTKIKEMSLFILQNEEGSKKWPVTPEKIKKLRESFELTTTDD